MKKFIVGLFLLFSSGCEYGDETIKIFHPETAVLIESTREPVTEIYPKSDNLDWFIVPQVIVNNYQESVTFSVRLYSRSEKVKFKAMNAKVAIPEVLHEGIDVSDEGSGKWYRTPDGWFYSVKRLKAYRYDELMRLDLRDKVIELEVDFSINGEIAQEKFYLEAKKVRYSAL